MIQYARQDIAQSDIDAVVEALNSDFLTQGPLVPQFEQALAERVLASHAIATNSGTSALHIACMAVGLGLGDLLWTVPNSFVASANCALLCGADIDFVDIEPTNYCMDVDALAKKLSAAANANRLPKAIVPVHYSGRSAMMKEIRALTNQFEIFVIEDACHSTGGQYLGKPVGSCQFSDITVFSFHPVKIMTTTEGGIALTNNAELAGRMARIRSHGVTRNPTEMQNSHPHPWEYEQVELGLNYRMTDIQAALGFSQLNRLNEFVNRRRQLANQYDELLSELPLILPQIEPTGESAWHLYPVLIDSEHTSTNREQVYYSLLEQGIKPNVHFIPIHTQPYFKKMGFKWGDFPVSEWFYSNELSLPMYFGLSDDQQLSVADALNKALRN